MPTILLAFDSFKESMSALEACAHAEIGLCRALPNCRILSFPMADGGEGTLDVLLAARGGKRKQAVVTGPYGKSVTAQFGLLPDGTAIIESAEACGLMRTEERHPLDASSFGVGELIQAAIRSGSRRLLLTLGGSATNDGGLGMLLALGAAAQWASDSGATQQSSSLIGTPRQAPLLRSLDLSPVHRMLAGCTLLLACDVRNPLLGISGASTVFGPQKGADPETLPLLEQALVHVSGLVAPKLREFPGAGAAGGLGWALLALGAQMESGISLVMRETGLLKAIPQADFILTGEGAIDGQTSFGKAVSGIAEAAQMHHVPTIALTGKLGRELEPLYRLGLTAAFSITDCPKPLKQALIEGPQALELAAEQVGRLWAAANRI